MSESDNKFCTQCGNVLPADSRFCTECGHELGTEPVAAEPAPAPVAPVYGCSTCGGDGTHLPAALVFCTECRWLRPLGPDYFLELDAFMWQMDAQAMGILNGLGPLASAAHGIAEKYGRPVFEAATNGIRLGDRQMPEMFNIAVHAARLMSLSHMPEVYVSGERMWDVYSLGGYNGSFISIGSVLINFKPQDLLFLIAREMGHVRAGHVFWSTAMQFLMGANGGQTTILGQGVLQFLNPAKLLESAVEAPLMRWARHAEITADRAATLVTGELGTARQVLTQWSMKSFPVYGKVNPEAWLEQEAAADDPYLQLSEWTMSTTPYLAPRLRNLAEFSETEGFEQWRAYIQHYAGDVLFDSEGDTPAKKPKADTERLTCAACGEKMRVPKSVLQSDKPVNVRCPNEACKKVLKVTPKSQASSPVKKEPPTPPRSTKIKLTCVSCSEPLYIEQSELEGEEPVNVRCPNTACGEILKIKPKRKKKEDKQSPDMLSD